MDPATVLGVAAAAIQFIDFSTKLLSTSYEIWTSSKGELLEESHGRSIATKVQQLNKEIRKSYTTHTSGQLVSQTDEGILELCDGCDELAQRLIAALNKLKSNGSDDPSKGKIFRHALKSIWTKSDIERLDRALERCRQQLAMHILFSLREQQAHFGTELQGMRAENKLMSKSLVKHLERNEEWYQELVEAAQKNPRLPLDPHTGTEQPNLKDFERKLLQLLPFESMRRREEQVPEAHEKTFQWVFQPPDARQATQNGVKPWASFVDWLEDDDYPLYWITGKAGAGKSTLMKLICTDNRTKALIQASAKDYPVIMAYFYLWNSGEELQMSQSGLLRTLLYQALYQRKRVETESYLDLIAKCFSERWEIHELLRPRNLWPLSEVELQRALERLVKFDPTTRFVFFIDGLDEYSGEHAALVSFIQRMTNNANIKVCVASRPWPVFGDAFERGPSLRLEYLTYPDFLEFVESKFSNSPRFAQLRAENTQKAHELVQDIIEKASGVFLWVTLVVGMLLRGLEDGERLSDLQQIVDKLPADLEKLFQKMLDSIGPEKMEHASQLFQIYRTAQHRQVHISVLCLTFADEDDPKLPFEHPIRPLTKEEEDARTERMCRRLQSLCKGLLEARKSSQANVEYLHRTAKDFLHREDTWQTLLNRTQTSFDPFMSLCRSSLLQLKCLDPDSHDHNIYGGPWNLVDIFVSYAGIAEYKKDNEKLLFALYDEMAVTTQTIIAREGTCQSRGCWCRGPADHTDGPFLSLAVRYDYITYVRFRLSQIAPGSVSPRQNGNTLLQTALDFISHDEELHRGPKDIPMITLLLESGADPNMESPTLQRSAWGSLVENLRDKGMSWPVLVSRVFLENGANPFVCLDVPDDFKRQFASVLKLQRWMKLRARSQKALIRAWKTLSPWRKHSDKTLLPSPDASSSSPHGLPAA